MQNEPNLRNAKMNVSYYKKSNYEEKHLTGQQKNEPKRTQFQTPIRYTLYANKNMQNKPNLRNAKMNVNFYLTRNYGNFYLCGGLKNKPKQTQFQTQFILTELAPHQKVWPGSTKKSFNFCNKTMASCVYIYGI